MDEQEYNRIVDDYIDVVYKMAVSYTKSYHDANDIVQNVFMKLYQKSPTFNDEDHIRHWLIRVTINESKNLWNSFWRKNIALENDYEVYRLARQLQIIKRDNISKKSKALNEITDIWLKNQIVEYTGLPEVDFVIFSFILFMKLTTLSIFVLNK